MKKSAVILGLFVLGAVGLALAWLLLEARSPGPARAVSAVGPRDAGETSSAAGPEAVASEGELGPASKDAREALEARSEASEASPAARSKKSKRDESGPFLRGRVVDANGVPVAGAEVKVGKSPQAQGLPFALAKTGPLSAVEVESGEDGSFAVARARADGVELAVRVMARGRAVLDERCEPDRKSGEAWIGTFVLQPAVVIGGRVLDASGAPLEGATVRRVNPGEDAPSWFEQVAAAAGRTAVETTDAEGRFELAHEEAGDYELVVQHPRAVEGRFRGRTPPAGGELLGLELRLPPSAQIAGTVRGMPADHDKAVVRATPVAGGSSESFPMAAFVPGGDASSRRESEIDGEGRFVVQGLEPGERYELSVVQAKGFFPAQAQACSESVTALAGADAVEIAWKRGARVVFRVLAEETGRPIGEVTVFRRWKDDARGIPSAPESKSFPNGDVALEDLRPDPAPGHLELVLRADGRLEARIEDVEVPALGEVDLGAVKLGAAPILRVHVVDGLTNEPVAKARVRLRPEDGSSEDAGERFFQVPAEVPSGRTDKEGWCELQACATPTATLEVDKHGYADFVRSGVQMPSGASGEERVALLSGGSVRVRVVDSTGRGIANAQVEHRDPTGDERTRGADDAGVLELEHLPAGEHAFRARRSGELSWLRASLESVESDSDDDEPLWRSVNVQNGGASSIEIVLPTLAALTGRVLAGKAPVAGASVAFLAGESGSSRDEFLIGLSASLGGSSGANVAQTDERGEFELSELPPGKHRLRVTRSEGGVPHTQAVELGSGSNHVEVDLPSAAVEGRVVDERGLPVEGAYVRAVKAEEESDDARRMRFALELFGSGGPRGVQTAANGSFRIDSVPPGVRIAIEAESKGRVDARSEAFEVDEGGTKREVEVVLRSGGSIRVRLHGGAPSPFAVVHAKFADESEHPPAPEMAFVSGGEALLRDLAPGHWRVDLEGGDDDGPSELVTVRAGEETLVVLER